MELLRRRAEVVRRIREFFAERGVLEVETPLLGAATVTDLHLGSLETRCRVGSRSHRLFLQTSPEAAMKRLLAAGSGPIFQVSKAFRDGERGRFHNPEFTLLEWYRPGWDHHALMDEVEALTSAILGKRPARRMTLRRACREAAGVDPSTAADAALRQRCTELGLGTEPAESLPREACIDLIVSLAVQPRLGEGLVFLYDYPTSQAAMARLRPGQPGVAERFEVFVDGVEIANGYHELTDAAELRGRFERDRRRRCEAGLAVPPIDEKLLAALEHGLPACAGVAVGLDRLVMLEAGASSIGEVMAFTLEGA